MDARLASWSAPYVHGRHLFWRAAIAARLGEPQRAVMLLREALARGVPYTLLHENEDLRPLQDYAPFRSLMELKPRS
jgi:hypothetical protein